MMEEKTLGADAAAVEGAGSIETPKLSHVERAKEQTIDAFARGGIVDYVRRDFDFEKARDAVDRLIAAVRAESAWHPIETAPKDGTWVLVYWPHRKHDLDVSYYSEHWQAWQTMLGAWHSINDPTHWMPLPSPPIGSGNPSSNATASTANAQERTRHD